MAAPNKPSKSVVLFWIILSLLANDNLAGAKQTETDMTGKGDSFSYLVTSIYLDLEKVIFIKEYKHTYICTSVCISVSLCLCGWASMFMCVSLCMLFMSHSYIL